MARPNDSTATAGYVQGLREAKAAFQALPEVTRDRLNDATRVTVQEISRLGKASVLASPSIQTRTLYNAIGWSLNEKNGRGRAGVSNITTTINLGDRKIRIKGNLVAGRGGSASIGAGAKLIRPSRYAHLVEFGARHMPAEPFMIPAAETETQPYLRRCVAAGKLIETDLAHIGSRNL